MQPESGGKVVYLGTGNQPHRNVFAILGRASHALRQAGMANKAKEMFAP